MARRPTNAAPESRQLSPEAIRNGIKRLGARLQELETFDPATMQDRQDSRITGLKTSIKNTITDIFGAETPEWKNFVNASNLDHARYNTNGVPHHEIIEGLHQGKASSIAQLRAAIQMLHERSDYDVGMIEPTTPTRSAALLSKEVFIVHGHDEAAKQEVARFIEKAGLTAKILHELPSQGKTVIEKLEHHGNVGFAVVLLTPDDVGGAKGAAQKDRARQNVIAELFYFIARLGRDRVCTLVKGDVEIPSDIGGVIYTPMDALGAWRAGLLKELAAAGYDVDWAKALS